VKYATFARTLNAFVEDVPMFGRLFRKKESGKLPGEVRTVVDKIMRFVVDEEFQNNSLPVEMRNSLYAGASIDIHSGQEVREFGRLPSNPIPVNGPIGEILYLSALRSKTNIPQMFHRLGTIGSIDVFETVAFDASSWEMLFFDFYHPRKSRIAPLNYHLDEPSMLLTGTNCRVDNFPLEIAEAAKKCANRILGMPTIHLDLKQPLLVENFVRPNRHLEKVIALSKSKFQIANSE
jgi:hypothetical protein